MLNKAGIEWREAAEAVRQYEAAEGEARKKILADIRKRWKVAREPQED